MTDLFTREMPAELREQLRSARDDLVATASNIDAFLDAFLPATWADCQRTFQVEHRGKTLEVPGTPDFNAFDRVVGRYQKAANKLRAMLWDIDAAVKSADPQGGES